MEVGTMGVGVEVIIEVVVGVDVIAFCGKLDESGELDSTHPNVITDTNTIPIIPMIFRFTIPPYQTIHLLTILLSQ